MNYRTLESLIVLGAFALLVYLRASLTDYIIAFGLASVTAGLLEVSERLRTAYEQRRRHIIDLLGEIKRK